jgi:hypothetical protein
MSDHSNDKKIGYPQKSFDRPGDIVKDRRLSPEEKRSALNTWEQDAHQLLTAGNEGMSESEGGLAPQDDHRLGEVVCAQDRIGVRPQHKASH